MTDRALLQQALEDICGARLCEVNSMSSRHEMLRLMDKAIAALRERLAQPEQEPVHNVQSNGRHSPLLTHMMNKQITPPQPQRTWVGAGDLEDSNSYLDTPPQRTWVGLTESELFKLWVSVPAETEDRFAFARAIEAKLKEKNT